MPVYTYRCENCGVQFDRKQKFSESPLVICPECGKKALHKVYSPVGIVFKGSGFYATDHRSPSGISRPSAHNDSKTGAESGSESTGDAKETAVKPAAASEKSS